jgi:hypothetical protein
MDEDLQILSWLGQQDSYCERQDRVARLLKMYFRWLLSEARKLASGAR